ncbi:MAG: hypothetical protein BWK73_25395 [Thiothrix lacustris]|uniref:Uncharacterized protein n=1 Tax=Thiothrix lacustris TaxID=525917 RepID=A0A1Y1QLM5_9GAMM|nr:MAG: hypothetical protein BWK73_25395 [Thiothrix lacustris]
MDDALENLSQLITDHTTVSGFDAVEFREALDALREAATKLEDERDEFRIQAEEQDEFAERFNFRVVHAGIETAEEFLKSEGWL